MSSSLKKLINKLLGLTDFSWYFSVLWSFDFSQPSHPCVKNILMSLLAQKIRLGYPWSFFFLKLKKCLYFHPIGKSEKLPDFIPLRFFFDRYCNVIIVRVVVSFFQNILSTPIGLLHDCSISFVVSKKNWKEKKLSIFLKKQIKNNCLFQNREFKSPMICFQILT